ncbi:MAG: hypothetical protein HQ508_09145, partial [Candidatus Marinimicrobia bacterium]|nr:hypothetical protein [Candidatus Neomarinimicrobiota bacterium]
FPSLKFLKLLEQDALRKFNIKQLILLIIRTLMILLIILVFARPSLNRSGGMGVYARRVNLLIFAIDNTASNQTNFNNLSGDWLKKISSDLNEKGYQIQFCGITDFELTDTPDEITSEYASIFPGDIQKRLAEQIDLEQFRQKSLVWIGDGQDVRESLEILVDWNKFVYMQTIENDHGIVNLKLPAQGIRSGEEYSVKVTLGHAQETPEPLALELMINENRQNQAIIDIDINTIELNARVNEAGFQYGRLHLGSDDHSYNDERHFILPAGGNIPVQILRTIQNPDYWRIIESAVENKEINLEIRILEFREIDNLNLGQGGTVIIDDASTLVEYNWNRLESFVAQGGQLIIFGDGGKRMRDLFQFDTPLTLESNPMPLGLYLTQVAKKNLNTKPLEAVISQDRLKVFTRYNIGANELQDTWVRYLDDQPFVGSQSLSEGRIIWFNTEFNTAATNLPLLGIFPTLILQFCQSQVLKAQSDLYNGEIGDTLHFFPSAMESENIPYNIQRPDGTTDYLTPDSNYVISYEHADLPGVYNLARGRQIIQPLAVNVSTHEAQAHGRRYEFENTDIFVSEQQESLITELLDRKSGMAIWPILTILLLLLWVAETYLSRIKSNWRENV